MPDPRRLLKTYGTNVPAAQRTAEAAAQMTPASPFSPGTPLGPYDGFSRTPRTENFVTNYNVATRPRTYERVSFDTIRGLVESYDVAQMAIWHRIDSIRSLDWSLVARPGYGGDVTDAIPVAMKALATPDRQQPFSSWLAAWLYDILAYDAGALYRLRNRGGRAIGLRVVDGTTIAPLLDYWGNPPEAPAPAYVQYVNGLPWDQLTRDDLIYQPFRKRANSPYGLAPLETILLNANTDLRFQVYFLQRFTDGNIPSAFASAPETWTPDQIEAFQTHWDTWLLGDQAAKSQIKWMPGGGKIEWSNEKDFQDHFSLFLMRKTCAAFHVVPSDMGFTESVNRSSGESQADVQHRIGDLPLLRHVQHILSSFLQDDLGLPLDFAFDLGEEQADRLEQAQADKIYLELGVIGASDIREMRYGLPEPDGQPVPRFIFTTHAGPIPLASLMAVAGDIDPATAAPAPDAPLPETVFAGAEGVTPTPPVKGVPLAEQIYGLDAMPAAPPPQPVEQGPVEKEGEGAPTVGITSQTGITSFDLVGRRDDEDDEDRDDSQEQLAKGELAAFRSFRKARLRAGRWRDFEFRHLTAVEGRRLNQAGRLVVRKAQGEVAVAGLAVQAADTGRVLMLQRALDPEDPAGGTWEMPGGHIEDGESPLQGAWREWSEETGLIPPPGERAGEWTSTDGVYQGIVWQVPSESCVPVGGDRSAVTNPDDPDGDAVEAIAWWDPAQLADNPAVRPELLASLEDVLAALGTSVEKAVAGPKANAPDGASATWGGWDEDEAAADHWAAELAAACSALLTTAAAQELAGAYLAEHSLDPDSEAPSKTALTDEADAWLAGRGVDFAPAVAAVLPGLWAAAVAIGARHAGADGPSAGDEALADLQAGLADAAGSIAASRRRELARELAAGLLTGLTATVLARALRQRASAPATAAAVSETTRASSVAALGVYRVLAVAQVRWLVDPSGHVCPRCQANTQAGPTPVGETFPSGDSAPPAHPRCRCAIVPA